MNRKIRLKYFYKIAAGRPMTMRQKILGGILGLGAAVGLTQAPEQKNLTPETVEPVIEEPMQPQSLNLTDYKIKSGDNIMNIALKLFPGQADNAKKYILEINDLTEDTAKKLKIGQTIKIPNSKKEFVDHFDLEENHHLTASSSIRDFIKQIEKLLPVPTKIERNSDIKTIGYGHRLYSQDRIEEYKKVKKLLLKNGRKDGKLTVSDPIVLSWFEKDIKEAEDKVKAKGLPALTQNQFDALVSFAFNTGGVPNIMEDLKNGNIAAAANKIRTYSDDSSEGQAGLISRRAKEAELFMSN